MKTTPYPLSLLFILLLSSVSSRFLGQHEYAGLCLVGVPIVLSAFYLLLKMPAKRVACCSKIAAAYLLFVAYSATRFFFDPNAKGWMQLLALILSVLLLFVLENAQPAKRFRGVALAFIFYALVQSVLVILQVCDCLPKTKDYYVAHGLMGNPNALSISLMMPLFFVWPTFLSGKRKIVGIGILLLLISAIIILQCRSVWIAVFVGFSAYYYHNILAFFKRNPPLKQALIIFLVIAFTVCGAYGLYRFKPESTIGRVLIWKNAVEMLTEKPIFGIGLGNFSKAYNLKQAAYFAQGRGSAQEITVARFTNMPYNEYLHIFIESGIPSGLLFLTTLYLVLKALKKHRQRQEKRIILAAFSALDTASLFNYTLLVPTVAFQFVMLISLLSAQKAKAFSLSANKALLPALLLILTSLGVLQYKVSQHQIINGRFQQIKTAKAMHQYYEKHQGLLRQNPKSLYIYGLGQLREQNPTKAIELFALAATKASNYNIYLMRGKAYGLTKEFSQAEEDLMMAHNMVPGLLRPRYELVKLYSKTGQKAKALQLAEETLLMGTRVENHWSKKIMADLENFCAK